MRISGLELIEIRLPLRESFTASFGSRSHRRILLLRLEGCEMEEGWGECVAGEDPSYSYETTETVWHILNQFILPMLPGHEIQGPEDIARLRWRWPYGTFRRRNSECRSGNSWEVLEHRFRWGSV